MSGDPRADPQTGPQTGSETEAGTGPEAAAESGTVKDPRQPHDTTPDDLVADVTDSDPNGNTPEGLAGDMGLSSERVGPLRGSPREATHGAGPAHPEAPYDAGHMAAQQEAAGTLDDTPPEQNADPARGSEVQPDLPPRTTPTQQTRNPLGPGPEYDPGDDWRTQQPGDPARDTNGPDGRTEYDAVERAEE